MLLRRDMRRLVNFLAEGGVVYLVTAGAHCTWTRKSAHTDLLTPSADGPIKYYILSGAQVSAILAVDKLESTR